MHPTSEAAPKIRDLYKESMNGIRVQVAMQAVRKVIRSHDSDEQKLEQIVTIIHSYESDQKGE